MWLQFLIASLYFETNDIFKQKSSNSIHENVSNVKIVPRIKLKVIWYDFFGRSYCYFHLRSYWWTSLPLNQKLHLLGPVAIKCSATFNTTHIKIYSKRCVWRNVVMPQNLFFKYVLFELRNWNVKLQLK